MKRNFFAFFFVVLSFTIACCSGDRLAKKNSLNDYYNYSYSTKMLRFPEDSREIEAIIADSQKGAFFEHNIAYIDLAGMKNIISKSTKRPDGYLNFLLIDPEAQAELRVDKSIITTVRKTRVGRIMLQKDTIIYSDEALSSEFGVAKKGTVLSFQSLFINQNGEKYAPVSDYESSTIRGFIAAKNLERVEKESNNLRYRIEEGIAYRYIGNQRAKLSVVLEKNNDGEMFFQYGRDIEEKYFFEISGTYFFDKRGELIRIGKLINTM